MLQAASPFKVAPSVAFELRTCISNPIGKGPVWSFERSAYNQTGVDINVEGSLSASAGGNDEERATRQ